jgi:hypothetical protein
MMYATSAKRKEASMPKAPIKTVSLDVTEDFVDMWIVGKTPLIFNRMTHKAKAALLLGGRFKNVAERAATLKHDPMYEYRDSCDKNRDGKGQSRLLVKATAFKKAISTAALDLPGAKKTEVGRGVSVLGEWIDVFGVPELYMDVVRSADLNRTPDIRTRAVIRRWACVIRVAYRMPKINLNLVTHLVAAAGLISGIGDFRQEKGAGDFGQFRLVKAQSPEWLLIAKEGGRVAQDAALQTPQLYDENTRELLDFFDSEVGRRGQENLVAKKVGTRRNGVEAH